MPGEDHISAVFLESHPEEAARILERFGSEEVAGMMERAEPSVASAVLERMSPDMAADTLARMTRERGGTIVAGIALHIAAGILRRMDPTAQGELMGRLPGDTGRSLGLLLHYPEDTAGALMEPRVPVLPSDISAGEALRYVRRSAQHMIYYLYVVDRDHILVGVMTLKDLMTARPKDPIRSVIHSPVVHLSARAGIQEIVNHPGWQQYHKLPVTDDRGVFAGVVGYKTLRKLEGKKNSLPPGPGILDLTFIVGEACWVGMLGAFQGLHVVLTAEEKEDQGG